MSGKAVMGQGIGCHMNSLSKIGVAMRYKEEEGRMSGWYTDMAQIK